MMMMIFGSVKKLDLIVHPSGIFDILESNIR